MEEDIIDRIVSLVDNPNPVCLDIGTNDGRDTNQFLKRFPQGRFFAFEPDPRAIRKFRANVNDPRVELAEKAVGQTSGKITFFQSSGAPEGYDLPEGWDMSGSIRKPTGHLEANPWCKFDTTIEVDVITLDEWVAEKKINTIDFIWADVQGAEVDLIKGGLKALSKTRFFYTEFDVTEMYEGSLMLDQFLTLIPNFEVLEFNGPNVLLRNKAPVKSKSNSVAKKINSFFDKMTESIARLLDKKSA